MDLYVVSFPPVTLITPDLSEKMLCSRETALGFVEDALANGRMPAHALTTSSRVSLARGK
jgi:hypothetical protein